MGGAEGYPVVNGLRTFHRVVGSGEDVVLVHGAGVSSTYWRPAQEALARLGPFRVWAPDLPGFGRSEDPPWSLELPRLAEHLRAWLDLHVPGPCYLVGQSLGCEIGLLTCIRQPERVRKLVLAAPAGLPELHSLWGQALRAAVDALREELSLYPAILPDYFRCGPLRLLRVLWEQKRCASAGLLPQVQCPTLVLCGVRDAVVSPRRQLAVVRALPNGAAATVPGAHGAHYTHPEPFARAVAEFIRKG